MSPQEFNNCFREGYYTELCVNAKLEFKLPSVLMSRHYKCKEKNKKEKKRKKEFKNHTIMLSLKPQSCAITFCSLGFFKRSVDDSEIMCRQGHKFLE